MQRVIQTGCNDAALDIAALEWSMDCEWKEVRVEGSPRLVFGRVVEHPLRVLQLQPQLITAASGDDYSALGAAC